MIRGFVRLAWFVAFQCSCVPGWVCFDISLTIMIRAAYVIVGDCGNREGPASVDAGLSLAELFVCFG